MPAAPGDLPFYEACSAATGNSVRLYYEADLETAASSKAACLMGALDLLSAELPHIRGPLSWSPLVLTHLTNYIPPKRDGELRWSAVFNGTAWEPSNMRFLLVVMPHEETHLSQQMAGRDLPRWFQEGHAEWAGLHVTEQVVPDLAASERASAGAEFAKLGAAKLRDWGGMLVKPEAIERQLSAEDRQRSLKDSSYSPPGPFRFGPDDLVEDNSNVPGRYGAALAVFDGLEKRHGRAAVKAWVAAVLAAKDPAQIAPLSRQMLDEDLATLLR